MDSLEEELLHGDERQMETAEEGMEGRPVGGEVGGEVGGQVRGQVRGPAGGEAGGQAGGQAVSSETQFTFLAPLRS